MIVDCDKCDGYQNLDYDIKRDIPAETSFS